MNNPLQEISSVFMFDVSSQKKINDLIDRYESKSSTEKQAFVLALVADLVSVRTRLKLLEKRHIKETN